MADKTQQSYKNHAQIVPLYHRVLFGLLLLILIGSVVNLTKSWGDSTRFYSASLIVALAQRAADQSLTPDAIKQAVKQWRADTYRV